MKFKAPAFLMALALVAPLALAAKADSPALPAAATADQVTTSKLVYGLLSDSRYAYRPRALDEATSKDVFKRYLETLDWGKTAPGPTIPAEIIERTRAKYAEALQRLAGISVD